MARLFEAKRYNLEGRGLASRWCHWNFLLTNSFRPPYVHGVYSLCMRNEYSEYFLGGKGGRCLGLINLPPSRADCLEIWEPQSCGTFSVCPGLYRDCFVLPCFKNNDGNYLIGDVFISLDR
jgi:hypothetical protein